MIYLVEISRDKKHIFILLFANFEKPTQFIGETIKEKVAYKLMADNENSFERLVYNFSVKYNKLQINGYHFHRSLHHRTYEARQQPSLNEDSRREPVVKAFPSPVREAKEAREEDTARGRDSESPNDESELMQASVNEPSTSHRFSDFTAKQQHNSMI